MAALVLSLQLAEPILNVGSEMTAEEEDRLIFYGLMALAAERIAAADDPEAELERLRAQIDYPVQITALPAEPLYLEQGFLVEEAIDAEGRYERYFGVALDAERALVFGPMPELGVVRSSYVAAAAGVVLAIVFAIALALAAPLIVRLRALERAAAELEAGDLSARTGLSGRDAVGRLGARFDAMAAQIEQMMADQRSLLQAVAHELRTPAARIRFGLEMLPDDPDPAARIQSIDEDLDELDALVQELVAWIRARDVAPERALIMARPALEAVALRRAPGREVALEVPAELTIQADERGLRRAVGNLIENASRYGAGWIRVSASAGERAVQIVVEDDGPGVPADQRDRVFEPFARLETSRARATGGVGLGLAIARRIVEAHGGAIAIGESARGGASVVTRWPA